MGHRPAGMDGLKLEARFIAASERQEEFETAYGKFAASTRRYFRIDPGAKKTGCKPVLDMEPGTPGNLSAPFAEELAKPLSQRRGGFARGVGL